MISTSDVVDMVCEILCFMIPIVLVIATQTANGVVGVDLDLKMNCLMNRNSMVGWPFSASVRVSPFAVLLLLSLHSW